MKDETDMLKWFQHVKNKNLTDQKVKNETDMLKWFQHVKNKNLTDQKVKNKMKKIKNEFTLIELLVVVAIIAILAGMLMPALSKARDTARVTGCTSLMKNLGAGCLSYATDSNDIWMPYNKPLANGKWFQSAESMKYFGFKTHPNGWSPAILQRSALCPESFPEDGSYKFPTWGNIGNCYGMVISSGSQYASYVNNSGSVEHYFIKLSRVKKASQKFGMVEAQGVGRAYGYKFSEDSYNAYLAAQTTESDGRPAYRHKGRTCINIVYLDGHVGTVNHNEMGYFYTAKTKADLGANPYK